MVRGSQAHSWFTGTDGESYWLTYWFAWGLTLGLIGFAGFAWVSRGELFQAFLCLASQLIAISAAVLARRAIAKEAHPFFWIVAAFAMLGLCSISEVGIKHAWEASGSGVPLNELQSWFIALLEPLLIWWVEEIRFKKREGAAEDEVKNPMPVETHTEPVQSVSEKPYKDSREPKKTHQRPALQALNGGLTAAIGVSALLQPEAAIHEAAGRAPAPEVQGPRDIARDLLAWGVRPAHVYERVGGAVPLSTIKRWAHEVPIAYTHEKHVATAEERVASAVRMVEKGVEKIDACKKTGCDWDRLAVATRHIDGSRLKSA